MYNLQENYVDGDYPWKGILAEAAFALRSTHHRIYVRTPGQLIFSRYMDWKLIHQCKQVQIDDEIIHKRDRI